MPILNYLLVLFSTIIDFILLEFMANTYLIHKYSKLKTTIIFTFTAIILTMVNFLIPSTKLFRLFVDIITIFIFITYLIICYKGKLRNKLKLMLFIFLLINGIMIIVNFSLELVMNWSYNELTKNIVFLFTQKFIDYIIVLVIINLIITKTKYHHVNSKNYIMATITIMLLNIIVLLSTFNFYSSADFSWQSFEELVLIIITANFLIVIVTLLLFNRLQAHLLKMHETEIKALTSERMTEYYRNLAGNTEEIRKFRHDMRYHAQVIDTYLDQGQTLKARDYLKTNIGQLSYRNLIYIEGLPVVSAILSDIQAKCKQLNYRFEPEVYVNYIPMDDDDTSIIIGNILTNALEALKKDNTQDRFILFEIKAASEVTVISCRNHYIGKLLPKGTLYRTTKSNASNHGYGLNTIQEKSAKYNGLMEITTEHQVFHIQIFLPNNYPQESGNPRKTTTINEETPNYES
ncbi:Uncharacterised protein [uncultured Clostridium sp.]|nr:Uncharacterised protein [uncultured Clostridium sp.]